MARTNEVTVKDSKAGLVAHILCSLLFIGVGVAMLVVKTDVISTFVYSFSVLALGVLFICFGAYFMIKYFVNHEFVKVSNYGFTVGVILVIIGAVIVFMAASLSVFIDAIVCLAGVVLGAVMMQQAFALFNIEKSSWIVSFILGILTIGASIYLLLTNQKFFDGNLISCIYLITVGSLSVINLLIMVFGLKDHKKLASRTYTRNLEEAPKDDSMFEEEASAPVAEDNAFDE